MNGPGAWIGTQLEPVNAPQRKNSVSTEMTEAHLSAVTALSSPKVTVLSEVKSVTFAMRPTMKRTITKAAMKIAI